MQEKCVLVLLSFLVFGSCADANIYNRKVEKQILDNILSSENYDPRIRPSGTNISTGRPLEVTINLYVKKIIKVDDEKQGNSTSNTKALRSAGKIYMIAYLVRSSLEIEIKTQPIVFIICGHNYKTKKMFTIETTFRQEWRDERLQYQGGQNKLLILNDEELIWKPDIFFNSYKGHHHDITRPNTLIRINPYGSILFTKRYTLVLYCDMDLRKYPFDIQKCSLIIETYAWNANDIILKWKNNPVFVSENVSSELFKLVMFHTHEGAIAASTGNYSFLSLEFKLQRQCQYYLNFVFIPCAMMVMVAYSCLWIDIKHFTARIILALATLYTLTQAVGNINLQAPKVSYTKAIDVYTGMSITFVIIILMETISVNFLENKPAAVKDKLNGIDSKRVGNSSDVNLLKKWIMDRSTNKLDATFRILLPILFTLFQIIYWGVCLLA